MSSRISLKSSFSERKTRTAGFWSSGESRHPSRRRSMSGLSATRFMIGEPHFPQKIRACPGEDSNSRRSACPERKRKLLDRTEPFVANSAPDAFRHSLQWQRAIAKSGPWASYRTPPQRQLPSRVACGIQSYSQLLVGASTRGHSSRTEPFSPSMSYMKNRYVMTHQTRSMARIHSDHPGPLCYVDIVHSRRSREALSKSGM